MRDPLVRDAIRATGYRETGQLREFWGDDPPLIIVEAERAHHVAITLTHQHDREKEREKNDPKGVDRP